MSSRSSSRRTVDGAGDAVLVGRVLGPHGVRGEVVVATFSDNPHRFLPGHQLTVRSPEGPSVRRTIETCRPHRGGLLVRFAGIADRTAAEPLRGARLEVDEMEIPPPPEGAYYHFELVGCRCRWKDRELGEVRDVIEDGGGELLQVEGPAGELLVPFVAAFVPRVDLENRVIEVLLPEGFMEACASR